MNGLPDWDQMSVREQCEVLKAESEASNGVHKLLNHYIESLRERVSALEAAQGRTHYEGDDCPGGHRGAPWGGYRIEMNQSEYDRLRRIEEAAMKSVNWLKYHKPDTSAGVAFQTLSEALKEEAACQSIGSTLP